MKKKSLLSLLMLLLGLANGPVVAADAPTTAVQEDLKPVIMSIREKLKAGKDKETDLADNFKQLDILVARYKTTDQEAAAGIVMMKVQLYAQVLQNESKALELLDQMKRDFTGTKTAAAADNVITQIKAQEEGSKIQRSLKPGTKFPDFSEKDLAGKPLAIANFKGKVVLVDFWATWCGPCRAELPNVIDAYQKHHGQGFEIIGINLDQDRSKLEDFLKSKNMPWAQYFDGQGWQNKLARKYGVNSIPATYLLDKESRIIARDLRGEELDAAVAKALQQ